MSQPSATDKVISGSNVLPGKNGLFYGGAWHQAIGGDVIECFNPATSELLMDVQAAKSADVDKAVDSARAAQRAWGDLPPIERARYVKELAERVKDHADELALLDSMNSGNPFQGMQFDVKISVALLDFFAGLATELKGETIPMGAGKLNYAVREPLGVVARLIPFNHPIMFACIKSAAPLIAGNTVILKPSEFTPLSALRLAELAADLFPAGVFNVLPGLG
ncbi:MAG: aldehyde dehydrogenase family protein, partial [Rhodospirillales bacterium]|nr:aldehyde dehydrogenase family protein [Rhodospirillales bacterium]